MSDICEIVITAPDSDWLTDFTRRLVEDRLVAGAHLIGRVRSIYRWNEQICDRTESRVALHTRKELFESIAARAESEHPYRVPCVVAISLVDSSEAYEAWVEDMTRPQTAPAEALPQS